MTSNTAVKRVQRYEWEDRLIKAESLGLLPAGAVNMALRLASAIHWEPKGNKPSGLYWKNETALQAVNSSRATYFRHRAVLFQYEFFIEVAGNLVPQLPDLSHFETVESQVETDESQVEIVQSQVDNPYTVDTFTVDSSSEDSLTDKSTAVADAPSVTSQEEALSLKDVREEGHPGPIDKREVIVNISPGSLNETGHTAGGAAAGGTTDRRNELAWQIRSYQPHLSDDELAKAVSRILDREELSRLQQEAREKAAERRKLAYTGIEW